MYQQPASFPMNAHAPEFLRQKENLDQQMKRKQFLPQSWASLSRQYKKIVKKITFFD
jgi:hypothetical protein